MGMRDVGDTGKGICKTCNKIVNVTFKIKDINVKWIDCRYDIELQALAGECDECGDIVSIPSEATPSIKDAIKKFKDKTGE